MLGNTTNSSQSACVEGGEILDGKLAATEVLGDVECLERHIYCLN